MPSVSFTGHFKVISLLIFSLLFAIGVQFYNALALYMSKFGAYRERAAHVVYRPCSLLTVYIGVCFFPILVFAVLLISLFMIIAYLSFTLLHCQRPHHVYKIKCRFTKEVSN